MREHDFYRLKKLIYRAVDALDSAGDIMYADNAINTATYSGILDILKKLDEICGYFPDGSKLNKIRG